MLTIKNGSVRFDVDLGELHVEHNGKCIHVSAERDSFWVFVARDDGKIVRGWIRPDELRAGLIDMLEKYHTREKVNGGSTQT